MIYALWMGDNQVHETTIRGDVRKDNQKIDSAEPIVRVLKIYTGSIFRPYAIVLYL